MRRCAQVWAALGALCVIAALGASCAARTGPSPSAGAIRGCRAELRSWVVAGRGRHLFLVIDCPPPHQYLSGVVEFTTSEYRTDYIGGVDEAHPPRLARLTPGRRLEPSFGSPEDRLEAVWSITPEQAACLQRDRVWAAPYVLLGVNSNSAMAGACAECGIELPGHVVRDGGVLGAYPGVSLDVGPLLDPERRREFGLLPQR